MINLRRTLGNASISFIRQMVTWLSTLTLGPITQRSIPAAKRQIRPPSVWRG